MRMRKTSPMRGRRLHNQCRTDIAQSSFDRFRSHGARVVDRAPQRETGP